MKRKNIEQFSLEFGKPTPEEALPKVEEQLEKTREVETDSGTITITEGPTRTVWEGLEPSEDSNPHQSDVRTVAKSEPAKSKNITSEKRKADWEAVKKARRAVGDKFRGKYQR